MQRRKFVIGLGATASGGAAALGTSAFSRVEAQRQVSVQVASDDDAYLGLKPLDTPNGNAFVGVDDDGHLAIDIGSHDDAADAGGDVTDSALGVNSDSIAYFGGMFDICNQGEADAEISYELPSAPDDRAYGDEYTAPDPDYDKPVISFYYRGETDGDRSTSGRVIVEPGESLSLPLGECVTVGIRTVTKGVDATVDAPLIDGEVMITATAADAGAP